MVSFGRMFYLIIYIYIYIYIYTHICIYTSIYAYIYICIHIYIYIYIYTHTHISAYKDIYIYTHTHTYLHIYICMQRYIYIHFHPQTVLLYHNFSVWLNTQDASSWDWNLPIFMLELLSYCSAISMTYISLGIIIHLCINFHFFYILLYQIPECSIHGKRLPLRGW